MLTSMQVRRTDDTLLLTIPIGGPLNNRPYVVKNIEGLTPSKVVMGTSNYANRDGGSINSARSDMRNIVITLGYKPDYALDQTIQSLRQALYTHFPTKGLVRLVFLSNEHEALMIEGTVESVDSSIFTEDPNIQISIMCPNPNFLSRAALSLTGTTGTNLPLTGFGSAESGFRFEITLAANINRITIDIGDGDPLIFSRTLMIGDRVQISTSRGNKYIQLLRAGEYLPNQLDYLIGGSMAMSLTSSTPKFLVTLSSGVGTYTLVATPQWKGL